MATRATVTMMLPVLVVGMIGCASKKMDFVTDDSFVRQPADGKALVYFIRDTWAIGYPEIFDDDEFIGILSENTHIAHQAAPGKHRFMVRSEPADYLEADLGPGKIYSSSIVSRPGGWTPNYGFGPLTQIDPSSVDGILSETRQVAVNQQGKAWGEKRKKEVQAAKDQSLAGSNRTSSPPAPEQAQVPKDQTLKSLDEPRLQLGAAQQAQVSNNQTSKTLDEPQLHLESSEKTEHAGLIFRGTPTAGQLVGAIIVGGASLYAHAWLAKEYPLAAGTVLIFEGAIIAAQTSKESKMWSSMTILVGMAGLGVYNLVNNDHDEASKNDRFRKTLYGMPIIVVTAELLDSVAGGSGKKAEAQRVFATVHVGRDEEAVVITWRY